MTPHLTFRQLELSIGREAIAQCGTSPLETWYETVRDKPIASFSQEDLCKACRQQIFLETIIPIAMEVLRKEPLAGEMFEGELIVAMSNISKYYWLTHRSTATELAAIAKSIISQADEELRKDLVGLEALASQD